MPIIDGLAKAIDPRAQKMFLQRLAWLLERGAHLTRSERDLVILIVESTIGSPSVRTRRWSYVLLAFISRQLEPYQTNKLSNLLVVQSIPEEDPENRSWLFCAWCSIVRGSRHIERRSKIELDPDLRMLASALFVENNLSEQKQQRLFTSLAERGSALTAQWVALLFGYQGVVSSHGAPRNLTKKVVIPLTAHDAPAAREYAIWSLVHSGKGGWRDLDADLTSYLNSPPNVRRWYYQLLASTTRGRRKFADLLDSAIATEKDVGAREGLARAFTAYAKPKLVRDRLLEWYVTEPDEFVRLPLLEYFARNRDADVDFQAMTQEALANETDPELSAVVALQSTKHQNLNERRISIMIGKKTEICVGGDNLGVVAGGDVTSTTSTVQQHSRKGKSSGPNWSDAVALIEEYEKAVREVRQIEASLRKELSEHAENVGRELANQDPPAAKAALRTMKGILTELPSTLVIVERGFNIAERIARLINL